VNVQINPDQTFTYNDPNAPDAELRRSMENNDLFAREVVRENDLTKVESEMVALYQVSDDPFLLPISIRQ
jgi:hypothetical protein